MRFVLLSDTHGLHERMPPVPDGDVVLHAGDLTSSGSMPQIASALQWFGDLPHRHKVLIAGNHDFAFERQASVAESLVPAGVTYLREPASRWTAFACGALRGSRSSSTGPST